VLSEFAGAAAELHGALLTNPHDPHDMRDTLYLALSLGAAERESRLRDLFAVVSGNDIARWGDDFLAAARDACIVGRAKLLESVA
jgi:trehalose-6-phosphate synthase